MKRFAGLGKGDIRAHARRGSRIVHEVKVPSLPDDLARVLSDPTNPLDRGCNEAGPLSQWLFSGLAERIYPCLHRDRHTKAFLKAQVNKSDQNDAPSIAQVVRANFYRPVHVKKLRSQQQRGC